MIRPIYSRENSFRFMLDIWCVSEPVWMPWRNIILLSRESDPVVQPMFSEFTDWLYQIYIFLAECPLCYCGEIRKLLTFHINIYCMKAYHRPDHSIRIVECHRKILLSPNQTGTHTQDSFRVCDLCFCNLVAATNGFRLGAILLAGSVSELKRPSF
jgi:hypothetical protein